RLQVRYSDALADVLERQETEWKSLREQLQDAHREAANPLGEAWGECKTLIEAVRSAPDTEEAWVRLRATIRRIVEGIWCLFVNRGAIRLAAVEVGFTGGTHRSYLVVH